MKLLYLIPVLVLGILLFGCTAQQPAAQPTATPTAVPTQQLVGADRDIHGCIPSAGYSWCEVKQKCLRTWEEDCNTTPEATLRPGGAFVPEATARPGDVIATPTVTATPTPGPQVQAFEINASEWKFEPNTITVRKGITVRLTIQSLDQLHGIAVDGPNWGFRRELQKPDWNPATGKTDLYHPITIEFVPYDAGDYRYYNYVTTFSSANQMYGMLRVTD